jgi:hypothetical protein
MPSVRMAADRAVRVEVDVEGMVALIREAGTDRFIEAMLDFCGKCVGADFVSILAYSRTGDPTLVGTATTTAAENARNAAIAYMRHFAATLTSTWCRAAGLALTSPIRRRMRLLRPNIGAPAMSGRGSPTAFRLLRVGSARSTSVSVYRSRHNGRFSDRQLDRAYALLPIDGERRLPWRG